MDDAGNIQGAIESYDAYEFLEAEACDAKKKKKAPKMIKRKRKLRHAPNWHWKRCKLADHLSGLPDHIIVSILSCLTLKEAARTSMLSQRWKNLWTLTTDRLSGLPNNVIISILSRLTLKEAARTSVLSGRWKNMWTYSVGSLDFHYLYKRRARRRLNLWGTLYVEPNAPLAQFVEWVNHVLSRHQGQTVDKFEISLEKFGQIRETIFNQWVEFALRKSVKRLRLDFGGKLTYQIGNYALKKPLLSKYSLDSLTLLDLKNVNVTGKSLTYILVKCQNLEELCVERSSTLIQLRVPGPSLQLKCLKIKHCASLKYLEIFAINLKSFCYHGSLIPVIFEKAPHLIEASYGRCYAASVIANMADKFSSYATCLESLLLDTCGLRRYLNDGVSLLPEFPVLENLRQLDLRLYGIVAESIINVCASLLKKSPTLGRFSLKFFPSGFNGGARRERKDTCLNSCLRVLELVDFPGRCAASAEVACFLVSRLPSLQEVIIHPIAYGSDCPQREMFEEFEKQDVTKFAEERLLRIMPPTAKLIIPS